MNAVANTASVGPASNDSPRVASIVAEEPSKADVYDVAAQFFTFVLAEQTLKTPKEDLPHVKPSDVIVPKSEHDGRPAAKLKMTVSNDAPMQVVAQLAALPVPIVAEVAFVLPSSAPDRTGQSVDDQSRIGLVHDTSKTQNNVVVEVPTYLSPELSLKPDLGAPAAISTPITEQKLTPITEQKLTPITEQKLTPITEQKLTPITEQKLTPITEQKVVPSTPIAEQKVVPSTPIAEQKVITTNAPVSGVGRADDFAAIAHLSQPVPALAFVAAHLEHRPDPTVRLTSGSVEPLTAPAPAPSSPLHSKPVAPSTLPVSPISALIPGPTSSGVNSTAPVGQSLAHALNVGTLAQAISRPINEGNGGYTVQITMHPAELGHLQAMVTLRGNDLQVSITPQTPQGREALASAAHTLKEELSRGGLNVNVTLHDSGFQPRGEDRPPTPAPGNTEIFSHEDMTPQALPSPAPAANQIDLRL